MSSPKYKVLDLSGDIGGFTLAFEQAGFEVVCAATNDSENFDIYSNIAINKNILKEDIDYIDGSRLPYADILVANLAPTSFKINTDEMNSKNEHISQIILNQRPKMFLLKAPLQLVRGNKNIFQFLDTSVLRRYYINYSVFKEADYSGFSVEGNQLYIVGIANGFPAENFFFPKKIFSNYSQEFFKESSYDIDLWYRKIRHTFNFNDTFEKYAYYTKKHNSVSKRSSVSYPMGFTESFYVDDIGLRKLTHNEYAVLKGFPLECNFNNCKNKMRMYRKIAASPNIYILRAIAVQILKFFETINGYEPKIDIIKPTKEPAKQQEIVRETPEKITFSRQRILNIHIDKLKGLRNLDVPIEKNLTAIMGINGAGKSTILHALACMFIPSSNGEKYPFSFFFTPNPDMTWANSSLSLTYFDENKQEKITKEYKKQKNKWTVKTTTKPKRDVFYIGINTSIPEIEAQRQTSFINYSSDDAADKISDKIIQYASEILNKDYDKLIYHKARKKQFPGIRTKTNIKYSALSMGAGEQRVLKILQTVLSAAQYSLILIDEIDLLLHASALKRLIVVLSQIAQNRHLQIIFTTHSLVMSTLKDYVDIRYLYQLQEKTMVYDTITPDIIYELSENIEKPLEVYVEDLLSETIVSRIANELGIRGKLTIKKFGSANNAFTLAAAFVLEEIQTDNKLIVLDGDVCVTDSEKERAIQKVLTGTEYNIKQKIFKALSCVSQYTLDTNIAPEYFIYSMLIESNDNCEYVKYAKGINAVSDSHEWLDKIVERAGENEAVALSKIIDIVAKHPSWKQYVKPIESWLCDKKKQLLLDK